MCCFFLNHLCIFTFFVFNWYFWILQFFSQQIYLRGRDINVLEIFLVANTIKNTAMVFAISKKSPLCLQEASHHRNQVLKSRLGKTVVILLLKAFEILFADGNNHDSIPYCICYQKIYITFLFRPLKYIS